MIIAFSDEDIEEYMGIILSHKIENPVLIDKYLMGTELEVDAICDGEDVLIPGIMEHIERAGVHSGDSICRLPRLEPAMACRWKRSSSLHPGPGSVHEHPWVW